MAAPYEQRNPRDNLLYQLIETHFDTFEQVYDEAFSQEYGFWRPVVRDTVDKYLACGDYGCGVARVFCENCATDYFVPFSCRGRGLCPSCTQRRVLTRAEDLIEETFQPVPHRHLVVSLPKALRKAFLYNRDLLQKLPGLAWRAYLSVLQAVSGHPDARAGGVLCNHTFSTSDRSWHPHVHGVVMAGVFSEDGRFLRCTREDLAERAPEQFEQAVLEMLREEVPQLEGTLDRMQTWEHSGFDLYLGKVLEAYNKPATQNLTEYILRPSFSLGAIEVDEQEGQFVYRAKGAKKSCDPLGPLELLARISTHIPDQYKHTIFRDGLYSNAAAGRARREEGGPAGPLGSGARAYPRGRSRARRATAHSPELGRTARPRLGR